MFIYTSIPGRPVHLHFNPWQTYSFILQTLADSFLYASTPGRPVYLYFNPWLTCFFTLQPLADLLCYTSTPGRHVPLHFYPWHNCSFTLQPLADMLLYTSTPGRPVALHFNPWQTRCFTLQPLADLFVPFPTLTCLLWESFSHAANTAQTLLNSVIGVKSFHNSSECVMCIRLDYGKPHRRQNFNLHDGELPM